MKINESNFAFIYFHLLAFICANFALRLYSRLRIVSAGPEREAGSVAANGALIWRRPLA
jgi:hypothetical protein